MTRKNHQSKERVKKADTFQQAERTESLKDWVARLIEAPDHELDESELATLKAQLAGVGTSPSTRILPPDSTSPTIIRSEKSLAELALAVKKANEVVIDLETSNLDHRNGVIVGIGLAIDDKTYYVPIQHRFPELRELRPNQLPLIVVAEALALHEKPLIAHNAKYELKWLQHHLGQKFQFIGDTMLGARLLRSDKPADLKTVATRELDVPDWELSKAEIEQVEFLPIEKVANYCAKDCWYTWLLYQSQRATPLNEFLFHDVEMPLVPIVAEMEEVGYCVDVDFFHQLREKCEPELEKTLNQIRELIIDEKFQS